MTKVWMTIAICGAVFLSIAAISARSKDSIGTVYKVTGGQINDVIAGKPAHDDLRVLLMPWQHPARVLEGLQPMTSDAQGNTSIGGYKAVLHKAGSGMAILIFIGALVFVAGIPTFIWISKSSGIYVMIGGLAMIMAGVLLAQYPWVVLVVFGLGLVGSIWYFLNTKAGAALKADLQAKADALVKLVPAIDKAKETSPEITAPLEAKLSSILDSPEKAVIKELHTK